MIGVSCFASRGGFQNCTLAALSAALTVFSCGALNVRQSHLIPKTRTAAGSSLRRLALHEKDEIDEDRDEKRALAQLFVDTLIKARIEPIPGSDGMSYLKDIPDLEAGEIVPNIVVRKMTYAFWGQVPRAGR
jgi:hypothetical protein